ncbi:hypothetical protein KEM55_000827, partial [Ascosphaera atra]
KSSLVRTPAKSITLLCRKNIISSPKKTTEKKKSTIIHTLRPRRGRLQVAQLQLSRESFRGSNNKHTLPTLLTTRASIDTTTTAANLPTLKRSLNSNQKTVPPFLRGLCL